MLAALLTSLESSGASAPSGGRFSHAACEEQGFEALKAWSGVDSLPEPVGVGNSSRPVVEVVLGQVLEVWQRATVPKALFCA